MRHVIIPDIHQDILRLERIIAAWNTPDTHFVCLGDYFDSFHRNPRNVIRTCRWLNAAAAQPETFTLLLGNHDVHYLPEWEKMFTRCSGYNPETHTLIDEILRPDTIKAFRLYTWIGEDILCSHAGLTLPWMFTAGLIRPLRDDNTTLTPKDIREFLEIQEIMLVESKSASFRENNPFTSVSPARGGRDRVSGLLWCDWVEEFTPIAGIRQMVGHTKTDVPRSKDDNWNIDTGLRYIGLIEDGRIRTVPALHEDQ